MGIIMKDGHQYGIGGIERAEDVSYDNTESGMTATDVQGALDKLSAGLTPTYVLPRSGYPFSNHHSYKMGNNVTLNFRVQFPIVTQAQYLLIAFQPLNLFTTDEVYFPVPVAVGNNVTTTLASLKPNGDINLFVSNEIIALLTASSPNGAAYFDVSYQI